jgi:hypothetical protein
VVVILIGVVSAEVSGGFTRDTPGSLDDIMRHLNGLADRTGGVIAIMVDELQDATPTDMRAFAHGIQEAAAERIPIVWVGAGLPVLQTRATEAGAKSFTERAEWSRLPFLTRSQTVTALENPARAAGVNIDAAALEVLVDATAGYPYMIQVLGRHAWETSGTATTITAEHATQAITVAHRQLDEGLYGLRWNKCTPREQAILTAMAIIERNTKSVKVPIGEIAKLVNATTTQLSPLRARLINKELIEPAGFGAVQFTLPGMGNSIIRTTNITTAKQLTKPPGRRPATPAPKQLRP